MRLVGPTGALAIVAIAFALGGTPEPALSDPGAATVIIDAMVEDTAIGALEWTCDPATGLPSPGEAACVGIESLTGSATGSIDASYLSEVNFAVLANGSAPYTDFKQLTGTVTGRGSGSFVVLEVGTIAPNGEIEGRWRVVEGSGTGDLVGVTGRGRIVGVYDAATGLGSGHWSGVLRFRR